MALCGECIPLHGQQISAYRCRVSEVMIQQDKGRMLVGVKFTRT